jgi:hypothetical protein
MIISTRHRKPFSHETFVSQNRHWITQLSLQDRLNHSILFCLPTDLYRIPQFARFVHSKRMSSSFARAGTNSNGCSLSVFCGLKRSWKRENDQLTVWKRQVTSLWHWIKCIAKSAFSKMTIRLIQKISFSGQQIFCSQNQEIVEIRSNTSMKIAHIRLTRDRVWCNMQLTSLFPNSHQSTSTTMQTFHTELNGGFNCSPSETSQNGFAIILTHDFVCRDFQIRWSTKDQPYRYGWYIRLFSQTSQATWWQACPGSCQLLANNRRERKNAVAISNPTGISSCFRNNRHTHDQACKFVCLMSDLPPSPCQTRTRLTQYLLKLTIDRGIFVKWESVNLRNYWPIIASKIDRSIGPWGLIVNHWNPIGRPFTWLRFILIILNSLPQLAGEP